METEERRKNNDIVKSYLLEAYYKEHSKVVTQCSEFNDIGGMSEIPTNHYTQTD